jgi:hypothetical protein
VTGDIHIDRPPSVVFDFVADERNEPKFNWRMTAVTVELGVAGTLGARYTATMTSLRPVIMTIECTDRPRRLASVTTTSGVDTAGAVTFCPEQSGARHDRTVWTGLKAYLESERGADAAGRSGRVPVVTALAGDDAVGV